MIANKVMMPLISFLVATVISLSVLLTIYSREITKQSLILDNTVHQLYACETESLLKQSTITTLKKVIEKSNQVVVEKKLQLDKESEIVEEKVNASIVTASNQVGSKNAEEMNEWLKGFLK